ncbi:sigma factor-like helix-turn-helix DNA-binding protein [Pseudonocardia hydrocarbonoxydans]|uniref:sigma factor-like helix-turn-helix DNA-binding protein n=1 Tax=Pseudonocardia hydrocarbonoxydans TaxID=76726 RepID=UPI0031DEA111
MTENHLPQDPVADEHRRDEHRRGDHGRIDELIERSSLGASGARRLRNRTPRAAAKDLLTDPGTITAQTHDAVALLAAAAARAANADDHCMAAEKIREDAARAAVELLRPLVMRYCLARLHRDEQAVEQAATITDAACSDLKRDLTTWIVWTESTEESKLLSHAYHVTGRHVRASHDRIVRSRDEHQPAHEARIRSEFGRTLEQLNEVEREIIVLRIAVGLSATETAAVLGLRPGAVRALQHSALNIMRRRMNSTISERSSVSNAVPEPPSRH